jgi:hypothetical protein
MNRDYTYEIFMEQHGRSDKANAACNRNPDFREGYEAGRATYLYDEMTVAKAEAKLRADYGYGTEGLSEWRLGLSAARCHMQHGLRAGLRKKRRLPGNPFGLPHPNDACYFKRNYQIEDPLTLEDPEDPDPLTWLY